MQHVYIPITKEEYEILKPLPIVEQHKKFLEMHDKSHTMEYGYGFYGLALQTEGEGEEKKYIANCLIGSSCD